MNIILGNGISSYIIAACLNFFDKEFVMLRTSNVSHMPSIMLLKYKTKKQLKMYFKLFGIKYNKKNIAEYCKEIKVGYLYNGKIRDKMTSEMKRSYLKKQNRKNSSTAVSDNIQTFDAILLHKVFDKLRCDYQRNVVYRQNIDINELAKSYNIFDTTKTIDLNGEEFDEYLIKECPIDLGEYDYVYDCDEYSTVKRYSKGMTEHIREPNEQHIHITNYYGNPRVFDEYDLICNTHHLHIGRYATQSQTKQEDIIKYMFELLKGETHEF